MKNSLSKVQTVSTNKKSQAPLTIISINVPRIVVHFINEDQVLFVDYVRISFLSHAMIIRTSSRKQTAFYFTEINLQSVLYKEEIVILMIILARSHLK